MDERKGNEMGIIVHTLEEALAAAREIGYPILMRAAFALGGVCSGTASDPEDLRAKVTAALAASMISEVRIEHG